MIGATMNEVLSSIWPMLVIFVVVLIMSRIFYLRINGKKLVIYEELLTLAFLVYIFLLFELVTNTELGGRGVNIVPFTEIFRYKIGSDLFYHNVVGNIVIFIPFGFFISRYINAKKISNIVLISFISSLTIEIVQLQIGRAMDIDDILLNVVGAIIGFLAFVALRAIKKHLPTFLQKDSFYNLICIVLILIVLISFLFKHGYGW